MLVPRQRIERRSGLSTGIGNGSCRAAVDALLLEGCAGQPRGSERQRFGNWAAPRRGPYCLRAPIPPDRAPFTACASFRSSYVDRMTRERQLARFCRALIACCAFLFAAEAPLLPAWSVRDTSGWVAERSSAPALPRVSEPQRRALSRAAASRAAASRAGASRAGVSRAGVSRAGASRAGASPAALATALAAPAALALESAAPREERSHLDGRYLYLDIQTLLC